MTSKDNQVTIVHYGVLVVPCLLLTEYWVRYGLHGWSLIGAFSISVYSSVTMQGHSHKEKSNLAPQLWIIETTRNIFESTDTLKPIFIEFQTHPEGKNQVPLKNFSINGLFKQWKLKTFRYLGTCTSFLSSTNSHGVIQGPLSSNKAISYVLAGTSVGPFLMPMINDKSIVRRELYIHVYDLLKSPKMWFFCIVDLFFRTNALVVTVFIKYIKGWPSILQIR